MLHYLPWLYCIWLYLLQVQLESQRVLRAVEQVTIVSIAIVPHLPFTAPTPAPLDSSQQRTVRPPLPTPLPPRPPHTPPPHLRPISAPTLYPRHTFRRPSSLAAGESKRHQPQGGRAATRAQGQASSQLGSAAPRRAVVKRWVRTTSSCRRRRLWLYEARVSRSVARCPARRAEWDPRWEHREERFRHFCELRVTDSV